MSDASAFVPERMYSRPGVPRLALVRSADATPDISAAPAASAEPAFGDPAQFGPLAPYLALPRATDLLVNGAGGLWIDEGAGLRRDTRWALPEEEVRALAVRLVALGGRHVDEANPCADVRLGEGMRIHVVLPPVSASGTLLSIRVPRAPRASLEELQAAGLCSPAAAASLRAAIGERRGILVSGATGSGKTTLLAALLGCAGADERIVTVEDVAELRIRHPHVVSLEARQANLEGAGGVGLERLVREALRMRPDRLVVGECRGAEVRELFSALNTGHAGAGTVHANSLDAVPARLEALGALAGLGPEATARQAASAIGLVVHLGRRGAVRRIEALGELRVGAEGRLAVAAAG